MLKLDLFTITGEKSGKVQLPEEIFAAKVNQKLMAQAVRVYLANQRKSHAKTKNRGEVSLTTAKWYRQKHTGRARHGAKSAPIFVGGGIAHGRTGEENFKLRMPKKMKKAALFSALTSKLTDKEVTVVKGLEKIEPRTKRMAGVLEKLKLNGKKLKVLIVMPKVLENLSRATRNIEKVNLAQANLLNTYEVLNSDKVILMKESIDKLKETFLDE